MALPRCEHCALPPGWCICGLVSPLHTDVAISCIRHQAERAKQSNSVRIASLLLPDLQVLDYGLPGPPFALGPLLRPGTALLFPDASGAAPRAEPADVRHLLLLDGTWTQVRRMMRRLPDLNRLPRLHVPGAEEIRRLRKVQPEGGMATAEALAEALALLDEEAAADALRTLWATFVERGLSLRGLVPHPEGVDPRTHLHSRPTLPDDEA